MTPASDLVLAVIQSFTHRFQDLSAKGEQDRSDLKGFINHPHNKILTDETALSFLHPTNR